jgi:hypothetical protein
MATAVILLLAALGLWWAIVPLVHRFGLTITTPGGLVACSLHGCHVAALLAGGLAALANAL